VCTDSGILLPSNTTSTEIETLEKEISDPNFPIGTGSINMGSRLIGTGLIINNKNYLAGSASSGFELGRVEDVFGFI
ncbi:MAG TPA: translation initiation factor 6, partial [Methanocorpusculum sp.]|nr:translation initiation factor 6 [Methanocorpusculum sp.]